MQDPQREPSEGRKPQMVMINLPVSRPVLTYILLAVIVGIFVIQIILNQVNYPAREPITDWGMLDYSAVLGGDYYRLFTSIFLHADQVHLLFNGLALFSFGRLVEAFFGTGRFGLIYILGGLSGSIASFIFTRGNSVGASGAIFAIFGAEMVYLYLNRNILGKRARDELRSLALLAALNFALGIYSQTAGATVRIDNWAHLGGFFAGIVLAWFIGPQYRLVADQSTQAGVRLEDVNTLRRTWVAPVVFMGGMFATMIYAVINMR